MPPFPPPTQSPIAVAVIIALAVLIAFGMLLRWQRDRQRLEVLRLAVEKGVTNLPTGLPMWLSSLRQGIMLATLGVALLIVGGIAVSMAHPPLAAGPAGGMDLRAGMAPQFGPPRGMAGNGPRFELHGNRPPDGPGNRGNLGTRGGIPARRGFGPVGGFSPAGVAGPTRPFMRRAGIIGRRFPSPIRRQQHMLGLGALAIGFILTLLGAVRMGFAIVERKYTSAEEGISVDSPPGTEFP